jgi:hypothetical protein
MKTNLFFSGCFFLCFVTRIFSQNPYPDFPPANVTAEQDRDQMLWQLGLWLLIIRNFNPTMVSI